MATASTLDGVAPRPGCRPPPPAGGTPDLTIVKIDIDADELDRHDRGTIGVCGDAAEACAALISALGDLPGPG